MGLKASPGDPSVYVSPSGLRWGLANGSQYQEAHRITHVLVHCFPADASKIGPHSIFTLPPRDVVQLIDDTWRAGPAALPDKPVVYIVDTGRVIGTAAAWITITLSESRPPDPAKMAVVGAMVAGTYVLIGAILTKWLPEPKRNALSAVYAMARRVDDIGDGDLTPARKRAELARARDVATAPAEFPDDPVAVALADAARRLPIPLAALHQAGSLVLLTSLLWWRGRIPTTLRPSNLTQYLWAQQTKQIRPVRTRVLRRSN